MKHWTKYYLEFEKVNKKLIKRSAKFFLINFFEVTFLYYKYVINFVDL
jgi:hypothetical protein